MNQGDANSGPLDPPGKGAASHVPPDARPFVDHIITGEVALFLSLEGCLCSASTPERPSVSARNQELLRRLARHCPVVIVGERDASQLCQLVDVEGLFYVGNNGFEIEDQEHRRIDPHHGDDFLPVLALAAVELRQRLQARADRQLIRPGSRTGVVDIERRHFSITVRLDQVLEHERAQIAEAIDEVVAEHVELKTVTGVGALHIVPAIDWDEGRAVEWLLERFEITRPAISPLYVGDLHTGRRVFRILQRRGISIAVDGVQEEAHTAHFRLPNLEAVTEFLQQVAVRAERAVHDEGWILRYQGFDVEQQGVRETLCTLGNGYFATRGAAAEAVADADHYPATYLAGTYDRLRTVRAGRSVENEDLVNFPNWLSLRLRFDGEDWFDLRRVDVLAFEQELDIRQGLLHRRVRFRDAQGRTTRLRETRLVHMADMHLAALQCEVVAEDWSGSVEIRSCLDARVTNDNVQRYRGLRNRHLEVLELGQCDPETVHLRVRTLQSRVELVQAARTRIFFEDQAVHPQRHYVEDVQGVVGHQFGVDLRPEVPVTVEKFVTVYCSRDRAVSECGHNARKHVTRAPSFAQALKSHVRAWNHIWRRFDIGLAGKKALPQVQNAALILRLHIYHLVQTASPISFDLDVGIPARGWHGEGYRGHVFWDELFVFPLLNLRAPAVTRALLLYRYRRLDEARARARAAGLRGAMYPWQSGSDGREETPLAHYDSARAQWFEELTWMQCHINAALVYNVWHYYQVTADIEFLDRYASLIILEVARFFASITHYDESSDRFEIWNVMGPDEYHNSYPGADKPGLRNNAYTNLMAVWVMGRALEVLDLLPHPRVMELCESLELGFDEIERWKAIEQRMRVIFFGDGIISQFEGYDALEEFDWDWYRREYGNLQRIDSILADEGKSLNDYKISKQADVLMLFYLFTEQELADIFHRLGYDFNEQTIATNVDYYLSRTAHGSTLSRIVNSWVVAETNMGRAWEIFNQALLSDIADIQGGTTREGIHLGAMAGTVDIVLRVFVGIDIREDILHFRPSLPPEIDWLHLNIRYRGHVLTVVLEAGRLMVTTGASSAPPIRVGFDGRIVEMGAFQAECFGLPPRHGVGTEIVLH